MKFLGFASVLLALTAPAFGHWMLSNHQGAMDTAPLQAKKKEGGAFGLSLECSADDVPIARFSTPEKVGLARAELMNAASINLVVQVDENRHFVLAGKTDSAGDGQLSVTGEMPLDLLAQMGKAEQSVTSGLKILGAVYYTTAFSVDSARIAGRALARGCGANF
ncbi:hypothetical protein [Palleronia pelagia]|uniref:Invasion protein IalB, involved in pathogenesis n=1 Tax=Palleronia pelagia TaxID=387096 RepID=A0A1H8DQC9_9RHOB|nr:hypothetical protein [Palleronia pelagia]SEN09482.1 hypothetical protein SAMN04488011_102435 [Palleronia pelagia]